MTKKSIPDDVAKKPKMSRKLSRSDFLNDDNTSSEGSTVAAAAAAAAAIAAVGGSMGGNFF